MAQLEQNPWLKVPLEDYEGHMRAPSVAQLEALAEIFGQVLERCRPESVAVLGVAGGNGLERIRPAVTRRIVGVDVNRAYLDATRRRFAHLPGLELVAADLACDALGAAPVALVHAALIFEHAGTERCLENAASLVAEGGRLSVVLQLESASEAAVGETGYASLARLAGEFRFVDPAGFTARLQGLGFVLTHSERREVASGKAFWIGIFAR